VDLPVRKFKSMEVALKTLEPYIRNATHLQSGRPFQNFGDMRSREAVANWLLCATVNAIEPHRQLSFTTTDDLIRGDGIIHDENSDKLFPTEHVMVSSQQAGDGQALILKAINDKRNKGASAYASGMTLVVFVNANTGEWFPNRVAHALPDPLYFETVWVVSLQEVEADGTYVYGVAHLDVSQGDAPAFHVRISKDFDAWRSPASNEVHRVRRMRGLRPIVWRIQILGVTFGANE
jgi:hypothetical protein